HRQRAIRVDVQDPAVEKARLPGDGQRCGWRDVDGFPADFGADQSLIAQRHRPAEPEIPPDVSDARKAGRGLDGAGRADGERAGAGGFDISAERAAAFDYDGIGKRVADVKSNSSSIGSKVQR